MCDVRGKMRVLIVTLSETDNHCSVLRREIIYPAYILKVHSDDYVNNRLGT